jgi:hypothetical protein
VIVIPERIYAYLIITASSISSNLGLFSSKLVSAKEYNFNHRSSTCKVIFVLVSQKTKRTKDRTELSNRAEENIFTDILKKNSDMYSTWIDLIYIGMMVLEKL